MKKYCTYRYTSLIVRKFPIKILKKYRNALILTQDTSNQSCRVRLTHVRTERYILIVSTLRVKLHTLQKIRVNLYAHPRVCPVSNKITAKPNRLL